MQAWDSTISMAIPGSEQVQCIHPAGGNLFLGWVLSRRLSILVQNRRAVNTVLGIEGDNRIPSTEKERNRTSDKGYRKFLAAWWSFYREACGLFYYYLRRLRASPLHQNRPPRNLQVLCEYLDLPRAWQVEFKARIIAMNWAVRFYLPLVFSFYGALGVQGLPEAASKRQT